MTNENTPGGTTVSDAQVGEALRAWAGQRFCSEVEKMRAALETFAESREVPVNPEPSLQGSVGDLITDSTPYKLLTSNGAVDQAKVVNYNKATIVSALKRAGAIDASILYEGQCDEGQVIHVEFSRADYDNPKCVQAFQVGELELNVKYVMQTSTYDDMKKAWNTNITENTLSITSAMECFCYELITLSGHGGFENNNGGNGVVTFNVATGEVTHDHYDNITEQAHSVNTY